MKSKPKLFGTIRNHDVFWVLILLIPALFINLGIMPLGGDEAIRALVSMEMMLSGDYLTPTLNGELYFNKPPLYNWILIFFFRIFNSNSEFICRLPTTFFLIIYCLTIFWFVKKQMGTQTGILAAVMFLTCGRILFRDSFLGLIDITFSGVIFLNFMLIWHYYVKQKFVALFIISYALTAIGFLLKGLPSLAFEGITLLVWFVSSRNFRKLFSWQHFLGIGLFFLMVLSYYYLYYLQHPSETGTLLLRLISESTQKSAIGNTLIGNIKHVFEFPYDVILHFAPWSLLVILIFNRPIWKRALSDPFTKYCALVFITNLAIYWISPVTYMRYLLMLFPLLFIVFLRLAKYHALTNSRNYIILKMMLLIGMGLLIIVNTFIPIIFRNQLPVNHLFVKAGILLIIGLAASYFLYFKRKNTNLIYTMVVILLLSRISFNMFLFPYRQIISWTSLCRHDAIQLAQKTKGENLYLMTDTITIPNAYYITRERNEILRFKESSFEGPYFIIEDTSVYPGQFRKEYSMRIPMKYQSFYAGKFETDTVKSYKSPIK